MPIVFLRDIHEGHLSLKDADEEQSTFPANVNNLDKGKNNETEEYYLVKEKMFLTVTLKAGYFQ